MLKEKIIEIIQSFCAVDEEVTYDSELGLLSLDSLSFVELMVTIEEEFGIEFEFDEINIASWNTVGDLVNKVEEKFNAEKEN